MNRDDRIYNEVWTGQWWHAVQVHHILYFIKFCSSHLQSKLPKGAAVAPVIIATDKTQLTQLSGGKAAYPVYLTLGNIPKAIRRKPSKHACVLIAYLPTETISRHKIKKREAGSRHQRLFHESMRIVLEPLKAAGKNGVEICGGDGAVCLVHPILTCYIADFPEQCLVACSKLEHAPNVKCLPNTFKIHQLHLLTHSNGLRMS